MLGAVAAAIVCAEAFGPPDLTVDVEAQWVRPGGRHQYGRLCSPSVTPVRVRLSNSRDAERGLELAVAFESSGFEISQPVVVPAQGRVELTLLAVAQSPAGFGLGPEHARMSVEEGGRVLFRDFFPAGPRTAAGRYNEAEILLIARPEMGLDGRSVFFRESPEALQRARTHLLSPEALPPQAWQGYAFVPMVVVHGPALASLGPREKEALWKHAAAGGSVVLVDATLGDLLPGPAAQALSAKGASVPHGVSHRFLLGEIAVADPIPGGDLAEYLGDWGEGGTPPPRTRTECSLPPAWAAFSLEVSRAADIAERARRDSGETGRAASVPKPLDEDFRQPPITTYLLILGSFALVAGPLNYLFLRRTKRPLLLLATAPAASLAFVAILLGASLLASGLALRQAVATFTVLDQGLGLRATAAEFALVSSLPPRALRMPRDRLVVPLQPRGKIAVRLEEGQIFRGLIAPRIPGTFYAAEVGPARNRLVLEKRDGGLAVVNGLGTRILRVLVRAGPELHVAGTVDSGAEAALSPAGDASKALAAQGPLKPTISKLLAALLPSATGEPWYASPARFYEVPEKGDFFAAVVEAPPFWTPLEGARVVAEQHIVFGTLDHAP